MDLHRPLIPSVFLLPKQTSSLNSTPSASQQSSLRQKSTSSILIEQASDKQQLLRVHPSILVPLLLFMQETKQQQSSSLPALLFLFPAATPSSIDLSPIDNKPHPPLSRTLFTKANQQAAKQPSAANVWFQ
jgi:hypothetical protein